MANFFECYLNNNPLAEADIVSSLSAAVFETISTSQVIEVPTGTVDGVNATFTLSAIPNPSSFLSLNKINGGSFVTLDLGVDYSVAVMGGVFTITMVSPPIIGDSLQGIYYVL